MKPQRQIRKTSFATDGLQNFVARVGVTGNNALSASSYGTSGLTQQPRKLDLMYSGSWIVRKVVDAIAEDMTTAGVDIQGTDMADEIHDVLAKTGVWNGLLEGMRWGRLYGGAIGVIMIEGQDLSTPLRVETVGRGTFKGLTIIDRWRLAIEGTTTLAAGMMAGLPEFYTLSATNERIHHSRVIRFTGDDLPYWEALKHQGWTASVLESMDDVMVAFNSVTMGVANLTFRAYLRTVRIERLRDVLSAGGTAEENLLKQFKLMQVLQTNEGITLLDKNDEFQTHAYSFGGLSDIMDKFGEQLSGASGIPLVRLFGQSPKGLNSTGDGDIRNYYDRVHALQEARMRTPMERLLQVAHRSASGQGAPVEMRFSFVSLWQMSEKEKAEIGKANVESVVQLEGAGIIGRATAMREVRRASDVTGLGSTITDTEIDEADEEPPMPAVEGLPPGADPAVESEVKTTDAAWRRWWRKR